jgi:hypothetical protein
MTSEEARHYLGKIAKVFTRYHSTGEDGYASGVKAALKNFMEQYEDFFTTNKLLIMSLDGNTFTVPDILPKLTKPLIDTVNGFISIEDEKLQQCLRTDFFHSIISEVGKLSDELGKNKSAASELSSAKKSFNQLAKLLKQIPQASDQEVSKSLDAFLADFGRIVRKDKAFKQLINEKKLFQVDQQRMQIPSDLEFLPNAFLTLVKLRAEFQSSDILKEKKVPQGNFSNLHKVVYSIYYLCTLIRKESKENKKGKVKLDAAKAIAAALKTGEEKGTQGLVQAIVVFYRLMLDQAGSSRSIDIVLAETFRVLVKQFHEGAAVNAVSSLVGVNRTSHPVTDDAPVVDFDAGKKGRGRGPTLFGHSFPKTAAADDDSSGSDDDKKSSASSSTSTTARGGDNDDVPYEIVGVSSKVESLSNSDMNDSDSDSSDDQVAPPARLPTPPVN